MENCEYQIDDIKIIGVFDIPTKYELLSSLYLFTSHNYIFPF